jgi:hydroxypyruvate reductase
LEGRKKMNSERFMTQSLITSPIGHIVSSILLKAIDAVNPEKAVAQFLHREESKLYIGKKSYEINQIGRIFLIGFGKASVPMGYAAINTLGGYLDSGILITKKYNNSTVLGIPVIEGSHPIPDQRSTDASRRIIQLLSSTKENDLVICLISGGGSSLMTLPVEGITLDQTQALTKTLLECGATINEINCLRKHISQVKGGQLARFATPANIATLILSDVVNDPIDVIASGPTAPDPTTYHDAIGILEKYEIVNKIPYQIRQHLNLGKKGEIPETPKPDDPIFLKVENNIVGNNFLAAKAAVSMAKQYGFNTMLLTTSLQGEASAAGKMIAAVAQQIASTGDPIQRPACIIMGGETTVTIRGNGQGGRNQELALGAVSDIDGIENTILITLATDGDDGPTDAAGAVVTGETKKRALAFGLNPIDFLRKNNSYEFFNPLNDLLKPGLTGTNVNDLTLLILF